jgi:hypothetical protein
LALAYLTRGQDFSRNLAAYLGPLFTIGMLLTWFYAVTRMPQVSSVPARDERVEGLEAVAPRSV